MWGFFSGIAVGVFVLVFLFIASLMIAFGGFTVEDTMPSEEDYSYGDDEAQELMELLVWILIAGLVVWFVLIPALSLWIAVHVLTEEKGNDGNA